MGKCVPEHRFNLILERETDDGHRNHRDGDLEDIIRLIVVFEFEETLEKVPDDSPEYNNRTQHRREMHRHGKVEEPFGVNSNEFFEYHQMSTAAHREEFGQSLDYSKENSLPPLHMFSEN
jgi:hypothetical protein